MATPASRAKQLGRYRSESSVTKHHTAGTYMHLQDTAAALFEPHTKTHTQQEHTGPGLRSGAETCFEPTAITQVSENVIYYK